MAALLAALIVFPAPAAARVRRSGPITARAHTRTGDAVAVLAGGCYWGVEEVFDHVRGIVRAVSGYAVPEGGSEARLAEAVRVVYDPARISYGRILELFFTVVHDPTELNRQGPDIGPQYRSVVFARSASQRRAARALIVTLTRAHRFPRPIVTEVMRLGSFRAAPRDQQHFAARHPTNPYIVTYDAPRLAALRRLFPRLYRH